MRGFSSKKSTISFFFFADVAKVKCQVAKYSYALCYSYFLTNILEFNFPNVLFFLTGPLCLQESRVI